jgi:hypothetical protein
MLKRRMLVQCDDRQVSLTSIYCLPSEGQYLDHDSFSLISVTFETRNFG